VESIGRYQIVHRIAVGGMAEVFLGRAVGEGGFEKVVAIKRILRHLAQNEKFIKMFMDEARISATLNHSNIGQIFEFGRAGPTYYIAMEYVGGLSLRSVLRHFRKQLRQRPPPAMAAHVLSNICAGLEYAHTRRDTYNRPLNIIHRDISPSNVLISFNGEVKLIDFGVAKASHRMQETVGGDLKGKYAYMSPEQASGRAVDCRSDVFSTGIVLLEMLSGQNPFRGENDLATLSRVQNAEVPLPTSTLEGDAIKLYDICIRALERRPEDRFQSAGEMQEALEHFCRRHVFGARKMARWMQESFPREELRVRQLLRRAAEEDVPTVELEPSTVELEPSTDEVQTIDRSPPEEPPALAGPTPLTHGRRAAPIPVAVPAGPSAPGTVATPVGPPPAAVPLKVEEIGALRQDPSRSLTPLTPSSSAGKVATPAQPAFDVVPHVPARGRRSNPWTHVALFMLFALLVGGAVFLLLTRAPREERRDRAPVGSVRITTQPAVGAQVFVDGELHGALGAGETYLVGGLLEGKHRVQLRSGSFQRVEQIVEVRRGETITLSVRLEDKRGP